MQISILLLALISSCFVLSEGANILLIPFLNTSHYLELDGVGRPLVVRGHQVFVLLDESTAQPPSPYQLIRHRNRLPMTLRMDSKTRSKTLEQSKDGINMTVLKQLVKTICTNMMSDPDLFARLETLKLDLVVLDNMLAPCYFLVPYKLGIPHISVGSILTSWYARLPILPSVVQPTHGLDMFGIHFCEENDEQMLIVRRLCRLAAIVLQEMFLASVEDDYLREYVDFHSIHAIRSNASFWLFNQGSILSNALPKLPHVEYVGGLTTRPPKPLEASLDAWMSEAPNVIVVSFGTYFPSLPRSIGTKLFQAFERLSKYRFVMRYTQEEDTKDLAIPSNVRAMSWLPQNDLLGHNSTQLFITHSGNNGQQEALYHGVPMLCFYIFADQKINAGRIVKRGFGKMLSLIDSSADQVEAMVGEMMDDRSYMERMRKASAVFHSEKHPAERAADAVEHVLKYGDAHLRPQEAYKLSLWEFYMLDVLACVYVFLLAILLVAFKLLRFTLSRLTARKNRQPGYSTKPKSE